LGEPIRAVLVGERFQGGADDLDSGVLEIGAVGRVEDATLDRSDAGGLDGMVRWWWRR